MSWLISWVLQMVRRWFVFGRGFIRFVLVLLFLVICSAGCMAIPLTGEGQTDQFRDSTSDRWTRRTALVGTVPLWLALQELVRAELVVDWPVGREPVSVVLPEASRLIDVRDAIELACGWVYYDRVFVRFVDQASAVEAAAIGRPRSSNVFRIRFVRVSGSVTLDEISGGATLFEYSGQAPDGSRWTFRNNAERSFVEGIEGVQGDSGVVRTTRRSVTSGVDFTGEVRRIPGGWARVLGELSVSAFVGSGLDRNTTAVPVDLDVRRFVWVPVHLFRSADGAARFGFRGGDPFSFRAGADWIRVDVRVDTELLPAVGVRS